MLNKLWLLDGDDKPGRKPISWEEVGDCCEMELQTRGDALSKPGGDGLYALEAPGATVAVAPVRPVAGGAA